MSDEQDHDCCKCGEPCDCEFDADKCVGCDDCDWEEDEDDESEGEQ